MNITITQESTLEAVFVSKEGAQMCICEPHDMQPKRPCNLDLPSKPFMDMFCGALILPRKYELWKYLYGTNREFEPGEADRD